jgi:hypothetical protein
MLVFLKKQFPQLKITVHGFRATFRTWAEEAGIYQPHAIEFCLAHELPNKVEKAYLRTNLTEQRKQIMDDWEINSYNSAVSSYRSDIDFYIQKLKNYISKAEFYLNETVAYAKCEIRTLD